MSEKTELKKALSVTKLWAIIVGAVISGMYFGWNYAFAETSFLGVLIAMVIVTVFYVTFVLSYAELATSIPSAAGPCAYAEKAFGRFGGFMAGFSILVEYIFATPGIALSMGAYVNMLIPQVPTVVAAVALYLLFVYINCRGIESAAVVEVLVTIVAIVGVVIYVAAGLPNITMENILLTNGSINGVKGIFAAIPYVVWFYLAVESGAMGTEECKNPKKDIPKAFILGIASLVVMGICTLLITAGNGSSELIVSSDSPLPTVLAGVYGENSLIVKGVSFLGLFGLAASLHGIIIGYSRQAFAMAREQYLPGFLGKLDKNGTPVNSIILTSLLGIVCVILGTVNVLVVVSCIGSTVMAILCLAAVFKLRKDAPQMERPYKVAYPIMPIIASVTCAIVAVAVVMSQGVLIIAAFVAYAIAAVYYAITQKNYESNNDEATVLEENM
jgi:ethanolamine permease